MQPVAATVGTHRRLHAATFRRPYFGGAPARRGKIKSNIMSAVTLRAARRGRCARMCVCWASGRRAGDPGHKRRIMW